MSKMKAKSDFWKAIGTITMIVPIILGVIYIYNDSWLYKDNSIEKSILISVVLLMVFLLGKTIFEMSIHFIE